MIAERNGLFDDQLQWSDSCTRLEITHNIVNVETQDGTRFPVAVPANEVHILANLEIVLKFAPLAQWPEGSHVGEDAAFSILHIRTLTIPYSEEINTNEKWVRSHSIGLVQQRASVIVLL